MYSYLSLEIPGPVQDALYGAQRSVADALRRPDGARPEILPRRFFSIPLEDLGRIRSASLEAVVLIAERLSREFSGFSLKVRGLDAFPSAEQPKVVFAHVEDDEGRIASLRERLQAALSRYGFPTQEGLFRPIVPLCKALPDCPPIPAELRAFPIGNARVRRLMVISQVPGGFKPAAALELARVVGQTAVEAERERADIAQALDLRLSERRAAQRLAPIPTRRPRRPLTTAQDDDTDLDHEGESDFDSEIDDEET